MVSYGFIKTFHMHIYPVFAIIITYVVHIS